MGTAGWTGVPSALPAALVAALLLIALRSSDAYACVGDEQKRYGALFLEQCGIDPDIDPGGAVVGEALQFWQADGAQRLQRRVLCQPAEADERGALHQVPVPPAAPQPAAAPVVPAALAAAAAPSSAASEPP
eukprot:CAMPEP_0177590220 /NCGR_PEP_ID=MMETSP0419_2-20121207/7267_1 /TAXON_ID=582737 /ORGANISM="Tetraselmis sp., Strain GSL018" /LENGTH=131 /DNA_ID=CAMNT_0019080719 /DNA_START=338 /DNA_END=729 /DNA_ORIENTATION=+